MSNTKFTKGEWSVSMSYTDIWIDAEDFTIAQVLGGELSLPDAHLIAAAPDMYAMIEELTSELFIAIDEVNDQRASRVTSQTENEPDYMDMQTIHKAQLLLKKARGE